MTAKEWLDRGRRIQMEIDALEQTKINLLLRATRMTPVYTDMPKGGGDYDKFGAYADFAMKIDARVKELQAVSTEIFDVVCRVNDERYRAVLTYRYLNYLPWEAIAEAMSYDVRHVTRLHGEALAAVECVLKCPVMSMYNAVK